MQLMFQTGGGLVGRPASDGPNYADDLSGRLRAEEGEKEESEQLSM